MAPMVIDMAEVVDDGFLPGFDWVEPYGDEDRALADRLAGPYSADVLTYLRLARAGGGPVLDLGSGDGRLALPLARMGYEVDAVDRCAASIERLLGRYACLQSRRPSCGAVRAEVADMAAVQPRRRYGLIMLAGGVLTALDLPARGRLFTTALNSLVAGGVLAFDFHRHDPAAVAAEPVRLLGFTVPRFDGISQSVLARQRFEAGAGIETLDLDSYERRPDGAVRRARFRSRKFLLDPAGLTAQVRAAGGRVVTRHSVAVSSSVRSFLIVCKAARGGMASC